MIFHVNIQERREEEERWEMVGLEEFIRGRVQRRAVRSRTKNNQ
jgi:hypothetical protein